MKKSIIHNASFLLLSFFLLASFTTADRINLTGSWKLNEGKSEFGEFGPRFAASKIKVDQKSDAISISKTSRNFEDQEVTATETVGFDGKPAESTLFGTSKRKSVAKWSDDGQTLNISFTLYFDFNGETMEIPGTEVWSISNGGKTLSLQTTSSTPQGDITTKAVYDKE